MLCEECHIFCVYIGATVGGTRLLGCPKYGRVYCER
jgi:hypothetical protein